MKIVVFADSHTDVETMGIVIESEHPDMVIHLGDNISDGICIKESFNNIPVELVKGNTDRTDSYPSEKFIEINNTTMFITHGDTYDVEVGLDNVIEIGRASCRERV